MANIDGTCGPNDSGATGIAKRASPGNAGKVMCSCIINGNKPIYKRRLQDVYLAMTSGTLGIMPQDVKNQISFVPGLPGLFLTPKVVPYDNYIIVPKPTADTTKDVSVLDLSDFEFPTTHFSPPSDNELVIEGNTGKINSFKALHYMWVADGSIFSNYNILPSECTRELSFSDLVKSIKYNFSPRWEYLDLTESVNSTKITSTSGDTRPRKNKPSQNANSPGDVNSFLNNPNFTTTSDFDQNFVVGRNGDITVYKNLPPGIHWRVVKKEPLFQGEDFCVTFYKTSERDDIHDLKNNRFTLRKEFKPIDIYGFKERNGVTTTDLFLPGQPSIVPLDNNGNPIEQSVSSYDFARQSYYIIEIGALGGGGGTETKSTSSGKKQVSARGDVNDHHYFIIIADNANPKFIHVGRPWRLVTKQEGSTQSNTDNTDNTEGQNDCFPDSSGSQDQNSQSPSSSVTIQKSTEDIAIELSEYPILGKQLMKNKELQIQVRQHLGNIVVTFNNDYNNPWVIERREMTTKQIDPGKTDVLSEEDFEHVRVPMIIPAAPISLMGGNRKSAFSFSPLQYISIPNVPLRQNLSVLGPVDMEEINLYLRDKGYSKARVTGNQKIEYSQDAAEYEEVIDGRPKIIKAMQVQSDLESRFGKAPDQQKNRPNGYVPHSINLGIHDCSARVGSTAPYVKTIQPILGIKAGSYVFFNKTQSKISNSNPLKEQLSQYVLKDCITPILTGYRLYVPPYGTSFDASPIEVGHHVMSFSDSWSATDFHKLEHTGSISFLVNQGMKFENDQSHFLASLSDKTFYIQVSIWWEDGIMPLPRNAKDKVVFTGLCHGGTITVENNKRVMQCEIHDYMKIFKDQALLNSPFFDKMRDFNAIYDLTQLAGFRDGDGSDNTEPASLIRRLKDSQNAGWFAIIHNNEKIFNQEYALPGSYDILQQPFLRFSEAQPMYEAIEKISTLSGKMIYFDRLGVFHFEPIPDEQAFFNGQQQESRDLSIQDYIQMAKIQFFASPREVQDAAIHRQVFNSYTVKRNVEDVINEIRIISNTPNGELLLAGHTNFDSIFDVNSPGFIGYPKQFMQMEGAFGSEAAVKGIVQHYTKMFVPPISLTFEAIGHNNVKALDIITFKGLGDRYPQPLRIVSVKSEVSPEKNSWVQNFECEWIFNSQNIVWGDTNSIPFDQNGPI